MHPSPTNGTEATPAEEDRRAEAEAHAVLEDPNRIHALAAQLHCNDLERERAAARACARLARTEPQCLQPVLARLLRVAHTTEDDEIRTALADALPRLELGSGGAGRLAFVFEAWLEGSTPTMQCTAMDALVALVPQRPVLARRIRSVIERRAALGSPTAAGHGRRLLENLREF